MGFRENLKNELVYSGLLVKELADRAGLKKHTIDNYLSVRGRMPSADAAVRIANVLGVTVEYLVTGNEHYDKPESFSQDLKLMVKIGSDLNLKNRKLAVAILKTIKENQKTER